MAKATLLDGANTRTLNYAHTSAVERGDIIVVSDRVLVAMCKADANELIGYAYSAKAEFEKTAAVALAAGAKCYYSTSTGKITATDTDKYAGMVVAAAAASDSTVKLHLNF